MGNRNVNLPVTNGSEISSLCGNRTKAEKDTLLWLIMTHTQRRIIYLLYGVFATCKCRSEFSMLMVVTSEYWY